MPDSVCTSREAPAAAYLSTEQIGQRGWRATIRYMDHGDAGHHLKQLAGYVGGGTDARRRHVDLAGIGLGIGDEVGNGLGRNRWVHHHGAGLAANARDRRDVVDETETELVVERRVDRMGAGDQEECIAIRRCTYDRLSSDSAASPGAVVDDEWLAEPLLQPLSHRACEDVARAAGGKSDDDRHRPL